MFATAIQNPSRRRTFPTVTAVCPALQKPNTMGTAPTCSLDLDSIAYGRMSLGFPVYMIVSRGAQISIAFPCIIFAAARILLQCIDRAIDRTRAAVLDGARARDGAATCQSFAERTAICLCKASSRRRSAAFLRTRCSVSAHFWERRSTVIDRMLLV